MRNEIFHYLNGVIIMREALFLKQNAGKWKQYEQELNQAVHADVFADRFIELTDDLSYARTFYPDSQTVRYLNGLTLGFHQKIYTNRKEPRARVLSFWQFELPYLFRRYRRQLSYAFLFFVGFALIGALSARFDDSFVRLILGDGYVNMTIENIKKGNPFGVYGIGGEMTTFLAIAFNNILVSFQIFVTGIFFSIGSLYQLMINGIMIGAFMEFFFERGLGAPAVLAVFIHGTIELSVIVIAGSAGLVLGNSLLFPKTFNRWESLRRGGKDALKMALGLITFFMLASFLEGFVTRHYKGMPLGLNITILGSSLLLILWYFIIYPIRLHKRIRDANPGKKAEEAQNFQLWLNKKLNSEK
jgi:uncharacterized membrane protein SpoIIM required for sporulation